MEETVAPMQIDAETRAIERPKDHKSDLRLWLRLLTCATLIETEIRRRLRRRFDTTLPRFDLMAQLEKLPHGMTLGEVSRRMMVSNGNITGLVEELVKLGLIERVANPADRRAVLIRLTEAGRRDFAEIAREHHSWIAELFADLGAGDIAETMRLLAKMKLSVSGHRADVT